MNKLFYYNRIKNRFKSCGSVKVIHEERAPQGRRLGDKRLEVVEAADVVLHVAGH
jgi:hypothetical protein